MANGQNKTRRTISRISGFTQEHHDMVMDIDWEDYAAWMNGMVIQKAMPYLTADEREFIMTGITKEEWDKVFNMGPGVEKEDPKDA